MAATAAFSFLIDSGACRFVPKWTLAVRSADHRGLFDVPEAGPAA
jgi:hypothetical protein